jgi:hypothetical protein
VEIKTQIKPDRLAKFRAAYLANGLNAYQACLAIGLSKSRARAIAGHILNRPGSDNHVCRRRAAVQNPRNDPNLRFS